jgi:Uma2 family endonuclease
MRGKRRLNLRTDPPPDLAVEVDVRHSSLNRFGIYAALRVPEIWRLVGDELTFHVLDENGTYQSAATSRSFPEITPSDLITSIKQARASDDITTVTRSFRSWVRNRLGK